MEYIRQMKSEIKRMYLNINIDKKESFCNKYYIISLSIYHKNVYIDILNLYLEIFIF